MNNKKILVILRVLTAYKQSFERCTESILSQTYKNFELIIVYENRHTTVLREVKVFSYI